MKLKATLLTLALLGISAVGHAAPNLQTCNPMEVVHNGTTGLSYTLACEAGGWKMLYSGSIPAGNNEVLAKYRLTVTGEHGENFTNSRQVRLPEPAFLGQMLLREAVLLDNGDLALRACEPVGCTQYRPLGAPKAGLTESTITGSQEILRLKREVLRLDELATSRGDLLKRAQADLDARQADVAKLQADLSRVSGELSQFKDQATAERAALEGKIAEANAKRDEAERMVAATSASAKAAADAASKKLLAAQQFAATVIEVPVPVVATVSAAAPAPKAPDVVDVGATTLERQLAAILGGDDELKGKYDRLKLEHEETLAKLERAQNQAALASAKLETVMLTQSLTAQNLTIAHNELDSARFELAQLKRERAKADVAPAPAPAPVVVPAAKSGDEKDALLGRVTSALVNSNTEIAALKAELERVKRPAAKASKK